MSWLKKIGSLFGGNSANEDLGLAPNSEIKTAPLNPAAVDGRPEEIPVQHVTYGASQSTGMERDHNEDSLFVMFGHVDGHESTPDFGIFIVADGMGGHRYGEVASAISIRTVASELTAGTVVSLLNPDGQEEARPLHDLIEGALEHANQAVVQQVPGGGTTMTAALLVGGQMTIGHVGDSRAYVVDAQEIKVITRDHSLVERLRELGQLTPDEAASHPQKNVLYRAIGQGPNLEVDVLSHPVPRGGYVLLCSDGLWGVVPDQDIHRIIYAANTPQEACDELVRAANAAGGPDNITAVLVHFPEG